MLGCLVGDEGKKMQFFQSTEEKCCSASPQRPDSLDEKQVEEIGSYELSKHVTRSVSVLNILLLLLAELFMHLLLHHPQGCNKA